MTRRSRNILFLFLLIVFLIAAPITVLYSLGWRFDWETKKVIQPGVFYFKVWPKSAEIYLDGEFEKKTDFFFGSALIEDLFPKKYEVEIKKQGFHGWKKTLEIKERWVTEAKNIILIPENPKFKIIANEVKDFFVSPDGKKIIIKESADEEWALKLFESEQNVKSHLVDETRLRQDFNGQEEIQLISLKFSTDSKEIILEVEIEEKSNYYLLELDKTPVVLSPLDSLDLDVEEETGKISPDSKKTARFNNYEIWVMFLERITDIPQKEAGDELFLTRFSEKISDVFWYTDYYLIFNVGNKIKVAEIDDRDKINIVDLAEFTEPKIFWVEKKLYILSEENLYISEELSP